MYLVRWFQKAMRLAGIQGQVYVFENDENAASVAVADGFLHMPRYEDPGYRTALLAGIRKIRPQLFFSLNDYELIHLSEGLAEDIRERGVVVPSLTKQAHAAVADKLAMYETLNDAGINTPYTVLLSDFENVQKLLASSERVILKDRFGSGSSGLQRIESSDLLRWLGGQQDKVQNVDMDIANPDSLVLQRELPGEEYGLDIVTPLTGGTVEGVLARRKLAMRDGETNVAETVEPQEFQKLAVKLTETLAPQGLIDIDVIRTTGGNYQVIDINPRFGGGYPFNHVAGANVPYYYVAAIANTKVRVNWSRYEYGCRAAKYEEVVSYLNLSRERD